MIFNIINPSDPYTLEANSHLMAALAICILGRGAYGGEQLDGDKSLSVPPFLFGGHDEWFQENFGSSFNTCLEQADQKELAEVLDSVLIGDLSVREDYENREADDTESWEQRRDRFQFQKRSSVNDIGARAWEYARLLREAA
ncbi:MAG: hypothetical protein LAT65_05720 [Saccharospirillum sp.]|nr:hypothetical protein [Saccharospirillum sp.]